MGKRKPEKKKRARELRKQGLSLNEISEEIGVSSSSVSRWTRDIELTPSQQKRLDEKMFKNVVLARKAWIKKSSQNKKKKRNTPQKRNPNTNCHICNKPLYRQPSTLKRNRHSYCSDCLSIGMSRNAKKKARQEYKRYIKRWKQGLETGHINDKNHTASKHIRRYLFEKYDARCSKCGWDKVNQWSQKSPLQIHHADGDAKNFEEDNLELLCPNCHSLTRTYMALNHNNSSRKERYQ